MQTLTITYAVIAGLCFGSFANVIIYRLPRGKSVSAPPSACPACGHRLAVWDLVPVISWLMLRGRCRYCRDSISWRYPVTELACAVLFLHMALYTGPKFAVIPLCLLAFTLLCVSLIDAETQEIPEGLIIFGSIVGIIWVIISHFQYIDAPLWHDALLGAIAGAAPLFLIDRLTLLISGKDGFGYGDVKLMAMAGLYLGWRQTLASLFLAVIAGGLYGAFLLITKRAERGSYFAFGPFLSAGTLAALWFELH